MWSPQRRSQSAVYSVLGILYVLLIFNILYFGGPSSFLAEDEVLGDKSPQSLAPRQLLLSPESCPASSFIMMIHVRADDFEKRKEWRSAYSPFQQLFNFTLFFIVGIPKNQSVNFRLHAEHQEYGDLIMGDYMDHYENMTLKHLTHLRFFQTKCQETRFLVKLDDDVAVNMNMLMSFISSIYDGPAPWFFLDTSYGPKIWCHVWYGTIVQRTSSLKWPVSRRRWKDDYWPEYCAGLGYIATQESVTRLLKAADKETWLWVDDVFVTGVLAQKGKVQLVQIKNYYTLNEADPSYFSFGNSMFALTYRNQTWDLFDAIN